MADEFVEHDPETPTEADVEKAYSSQFLGVVDVGDKKIRTKIVKVRNQEIEDRKNARLKKRIVIWFATLDKPLIVNPTVKNILVKALGKKPADWLGADVGVFVDRNVTFGGQLVGGVRLRVLLPPAKAKPTPAPKLAAPAAKPATEWPQEQGDPGFEPDAAFEPVT